MDHADDQDVLGPADARRFYDRFGARQDKQAFYEDPALDLLVAHGDFATASRVFEFGCGTGRLAARLLSSELPARARYLGCDISPVMTRLAARRLQAFANASIVRCAGDIRFPIASSCVDRVIATYVLDLLSLLHIHRFFAESRRVLQPEGLLCLTGLTSGNTAISRLVSGIWSGIFRLRPALVGGCRPLRLCRFFESDDWRIKAHRIVRPYGIASEVLILQLRA